MRTDGLTGIEIRHLAALRAVAETCSFSRAAERLGYAQSAVSQQIAALEKLVGLRLIERPGGPRPVSLTEAGVVLAEHAERILSRLVAARADLDALAAGASGTVRVGTFQSTGARVLPAVLRRFRDRWPAVRVELAERQDPADLLDLVRAGALDLCFGVRTDGLLDGFDGVELLHDPYVLLAPAASPFVGRTCVHPRELTGMDTIAFASDKLCSLLLDRIWRNAGVEPVVVFRTDDNLTLQRLVATGLGHAIVPRLTIEPDAGPHAPVVLELEGETSVREIGLYWRAGRYRSPVSRAFVETALAVCTSPAPALPNAVPALEFAR